MNEITLVFPDQIFEDHPSLHKKRPVILAEAFHFFRIQNYHKQRLILIRSAMKEYQKWLEKNGYTTIYIEAPDIKSRKSLFEILNRKGVKIIHLADLNDEWLELDLKKAQTKYAWALHVYETPAFLCGKKELRDFFKDSNKLSMRSFYVYQRKKHRILMKGSLPIGGMYSFDNQNRRRLPKQVEIPSTFVPKQNRCVKEAISYVNKNFKNSIGDGQQLLYPSTFKEAKKALNIFIRERLRFFGDYEDAIKADESYLFHSILSPLINIGILTPQIVVDAALKAYREKNLPINSFEGFIRQIIGWREFIRATYLLKGNYQRNQNKLKHLNYLPRGFWNGKIGIEPVDCTIRKILRTGYCHHIERLMILGNFLLLTETDPRFVYEWFMANFVDAYDWVMVPNVYGMSQYADGGMMITKPYVSGSNYILKMSDFKKGEWCDIWDGLFWRFVKKHRTLFKKNPRTTVLLKYLDAHLPELADKFDKAEIWLKNHRSGTTGK